MSKPITPGCKVKCIRGNVGDVLKQGAVYTVGACIKEIYTSRTNHRAWQREGVASHGAEIKEGIHLVKFEKPQVILIYPKRSNQTYPYLWDADRFEVVDD